MEALHTAPDGLGSDDARRRLRVYGPNRLKPKKRSDPLTLLIGQFKSPIILLLLFAVSLSFYLGDKLDSAIIMAIVAVSGVLGFWQEYAAANAVEKLLEKDLGVLARGVAEGRRTFANTLKYVFMATSANFGNMFSMAGASRLVPFLPLLPMQILLTNLMTDLPEMTIATDAVDRELLDRPRRWDIDFIKKFMVTFGLVSSVFDYLTFGVLLFLLHAGERQFQTGWFMESVVKKWFYQIVKF